MQRPTSHCKVFWKAGLVLLAMMLHGWMMAQDLQVPLDVQVPLMLKATRYDRNFATKQAADGTLTVGICYQTKVRASLLEMEQLKAELEKEIPGFKLKVVPMAVTDVEDLAARKEWPQLSLLYVTALRGIDLGKLLAQTQKHGVLSVCSDPAQVPKGASIGFDLVGGRPHFVINRNAAIAEGCDLSSQLLKLATVY